MWIPWRTAVAVWLMGKPSANFPPLQRYIMCSHYLFLYLSTTPKMRTSLYQSDHDNVHHDKVQLLDPPGNDCVALWSNAFLHRMVLPEENSKCPQYRESWGLHQHLLHTVALSAHSDPLCSSAHAWDSTAFSCLLHTASCQTTCNGDGRVPAPILQERVSIEGGTSI